MTKIDSNGKVQHYFGHLLKDRKKYEFLAYFPDKGITQTHVLESGVFGVVSQSTISHHISAYKDFVYFDKPDAEGYIPIFLNGAGRDLQKIARYMILTDEEINQKFQTEVDHLNLFYVRSKPRKILETLVNIYSEKLSRMRDLFGKTWTNSDAKLVKRLNNFNLVTTKKVRFNRLERCIYPTEAGQLFFDALTSVVDYIEQIENGNHLPLNTFLENGKWFEFVVENGLGWPGNVKIP